MFLTTIKNRATRYFRKVRYFQYLAFGTEGFKTRPLHNVKKYFLITKQDNEMLIINDRIPLNWKEIALFSTSLIGLLAFHVNIIAGITIGVVVSLLYILFRFTAWIFYKEIIINVLSKTVQIKKYRLGKLTAENILDTDLDVGNFQFKEVSRSGKTKFVFSYKTHKVHDLLVLKSKSDKEIVDAYLKQLPTTQTTD